MTTSTHKTALVLGATGSFGAHAVQALIKHGWTIRALARDPVAAVAKLGARTPIDWIQGDAMDRATVVAAARGAQLIVHAVNPPGYRNWKGTVLPMTENSIAAAKASGARLVVPGNVYNYAPDSGETIGEDAPQVPATRKGAIRVEMERRLRQVSDDDGVKVLILRAGDFFGPAAPNSALAWLAQKSRGRVTGVYTPGPAAHAFAYMPDLGETLARLVDAEDRLGAYEVFHFRGQWLRDGRELPNAARRVLGRLDLPIRAFPWIVVRLAAPFNETFRELLEMRYLQRNPIGLDNAKLVAFLGAEPHTPLDVAIRATLDDMGCLAKPSDSPALVPARA
ncbi:MAG TPA: NAD-dependent epimerase/dehydratase family protein [Caulobacteraceae bacterium]|nr:NAD-dependent epimerase/dehydratase family protein [Caulobacteraceae bacterium]